MPFTLNSDNQIIVTGTETSLFDGGYAGVSNVSGRQGRFIINGGEPPSTGSNQPEDFNRQILRFDGEGVLTIPTREHIIGSPGNSPGDGRNLNAILINHGLAELNVEGGVEGNPHTFLNWIVNDKANANWFRASQACLAISHGHLQIGTDDTPDAKIVSNIGVAFSPSGGDFSNSGTITAGPISVDIRNLILENPQVMAGDGTTLVPANYPPLTFRPDSPNYGTGNRFDQVTLNGFAILDTSGAGSARSGLFPTNIIMNNGVIVGDNGSDARLDNLIRIDYISVAPNDASTDFIINTANNVFADSNWFVVLNSDAFPRCQPRFNNQAGGLIAQRKIQLRGPAPYDVWIPETNNRDTRTDLNTELLTSKNDIGSLVTDGELPTRGGASIPGVTTGQYPLQGANNRYDATHVIGTDESLNEINVRMGIVYNDGTVTSNTDVSSTRTHNDGDYIIHGTLTHLLQADAVNFYNAGEQEREFNFITGTNVSAAVEDPIIAAIPAGERIVSDNIEVTLPAVGASTKDLTIAIDTNGTYTENQLIVAVKLAMLSRVREEFPNTQSQAVAEQYIVDFLDNPGTWTIVGDSGATNVVLQIPAGSSFTYNTDDTAVDILSTIEIRDGNGLAQGTTDNQATLQMFPIQPGQTVPDADADSLNIPEIRVTFPYTYSSITSASQTTALQPGIQYVLVWTRPGYDTIRIVTPTITQGTNEPITLQPSRNALAQIGTSPASAWGIDAIYNEDDNVVDYFFRQSGGAADGLATNWLMERMKLEPGVGEWVAKNAIAQNNQIIQHSTESATGLLIDSYFFQQDATVTTSPQNLAFVSVVDPAGGTTDGQGIAPADVATTDVFDAMGDPLPGVEQIRFAAESDAVTAGQVITIVNNSNDIQDGRIRTIVDEQDGRIRTIVDEELDAGTLTSIGRPA